MEILGSVIECTQILIVGKIKEWYSYITKYNDNINKLQFNYKKLEDHNKTLISKVDCEKEDLRKPTKRTDGLLDKVKSLMVYDLELRQLLDDESRKQKDQCCFGHLSYNLRKRYEMSKTAEMKAQEIEALIKETPPESMITEPLSRSELKSIPNEFLESLQSRVKLMEDVLKKLRDDQVDVVGIHGMGAVGKTTLVKEILDKFAKDMFDKTVMVEISESPNIVRIQDQIAAQFKKNILDGVHDPNERANLLYNRLKNHKKILIILDNVWEKLDLSKVGVPQPHENTQEFCCKLLLTSRENNVCEVMGASAANIFEVHTLDEKEARQLFRARVGEKGQDENIEKRMLKKCGGLPLSIVALADVLRGQELSMWEHYAIDLEKPISSHGTIRGVNQHTYSILETSCKLMESDEKRRFFMLACLFPFGSSIFVDDMMRYGIGLGLFQHVNKLTEAMQQANTWVDELKSSSLLLKGFHDGQVKIHDVVRAATISFAAKGGDVFMVEAFPRWMEEKTVKNYSAISLMASTDHSRLGGLIFDKLQMLILDRSPPRRFDDTFSQSRMKNLKVLVLKWMKCESRLPKLIQSLKSSLRTLHLEYCELGDIEWIGELVRLVVLSLRGSKMDELPEAMRNLRNLRLLDLRRCEIGTRGIPANVLANLSQLEGLYTYGAVQKWARRAQESGAEEGTASIDIHIEEDGAGKSSTSSGGESDEGTASIEEDGAGKSSTNSGGESDEGTASIDIHIEEDGAGKSGTSSGGEYRYASVGELNGLSYLNVLEMVVGPEELLTLGDQLVENLDHFLVHVSHNPKTSWRRGSSYRIVELSGLSFRWVMENSFGKALVQKAERLYLGQIKGLGYYLRREKGGILRFKGIKKLYIDGCNELLECIDWTLFPNLEKLNLQRMRKLRTMKPPPEIQAAGQPAMFSKLQRLTLGRLPELHPCVLPIDLLPPNLTYLEVDECQRLKYIFGKVENETEDGSLTRKLSFLRKLRLIDLHIESLLEMSGASDSPVLFNEKLIFEALENLYLVWCDGFATLWDIPCSKEVSYVSSFHNLKRIDIESCGKLKSLGSLSIAAALLQLEKLTIFECDELREGISEDGESDEAALISLFPSLRSLKLYSCPKMERFITTSKQSCVIEFPSLQSLDIAGCHEMQSFSAGPFRAPQLSLFIYDRKSQSMEEMREINHFLHTRFQQRSSGQAHGEESEESEETDESGESGETDESE